MNIIKNQKLSPLYEENRKGYEKITKKLSRSPNEADLNKRSSLENEGTMKL